VAAGSKRRMAKFIIATLIAALIIPFAERSVSVIKHTEANAFADSVLVRCLIDLNGLETMSDGFIIGYNYTLLERFAQEENFPIYITYAYDQANGLDSLLLGNVDMLVISNKDSIDNKEIMISSPIDEYTSWAIPKGNWKKMLAINSWLHSFKGSDEGLKMRERFFRAYNPHSMSENGITTRIVSPYDDIFKKYAAKIGWDWRMLAAVAYMESQFRIQVRSPRGAEGLMQMIPSTASNFDNENPLDPDANVKAGATYLGKLQSIFRGYTNSKNELVKLTLAAYNAGEGRILDCIRLASKLGVDYSKWDNIVTEVIPKMTDSLALADTTLRLGSFKGVETIYYVNNVTSLYNKFCSICPLRGVEAMITEEKEEESPIESSQSEQDLHETQTSTESKEES